MKNWQVEINSNENGACFYAKTNDFPIYSVTLALDSAHNILGIGFIARNEGVIQKANEVVQIHMENNASREVSPYFINPDDIYRENTDHNKILREFFYNTSQGLTRLHLVSLDVNTKNTIYNSAPHTTFDILSKIDANAIEIIEYLHAKHKFYDSLAMHKNSPIIKDVLDDFIKANNDTFYLAQTAAALPMILDALSAFKDRTGNTHQPNEWDIKAFILKYSILHRIKEMKEKDIETPRHLAKQVLDYLIGIASYMVKNITDSIRYTPSSPAQIQMFFAAPWAGHKTVELVRLGLIRQCAHDFVEVEDGKLTLRKGYKELLQRFNVAEMSSIFSRIKTPEMTFAVAVKNARNIFTERFFSESEAHWSFVNWVWNSQDDLHSSPQP